MSRIRFFVVYEILTKEYVIFESVESVLRQKTFFTMCETFKPHENSTNDSSKDVLYSDMYVSLGK